MSPDPHLLGEPALLLDDVHVRYGAASALHGFTLAVAEGSLTLLLGPNGAGKSTSLRVLSGLKAPVSGRVKIYGEDVTGAPAHRLARMGVAHVPEGRHIFPDLTVEENLRLGVIAFRVGRSMTQERLNRVADLFPVLADKRDVQGGNLSGGEQQMLAIGRALMSQPRAILLDEPSLGLAPLVVDRVLEVIAALRRDLGLTVLLVEQAAVESIELADYVYVLEAGAAIAEGPAADVATDETLQRVFLGV